MGFEVPFGFVHGRFGVDMTKYYNTPNPEFKPICWFPYMGGPKLNPNIL